VPCRNGVFEHNLVVYDARVSVFVNIGPRTAPETFSFRRNVWCDVDAGRSPALPTVESDGVYLNASGLDASALVRACLEATDAPPGGAGAHAYRRRR
jgi:hypothetical protein